MPTFKFKALNNKKEIIKGVVEAADKGQAALVLRDKNFTVIYIKEASVAKKELRSPFLNRIKIKDIVIFSRQFSVMISANVAMVQTLEILADQTTNIRLKKIILEILNDVDSGLKLSDALAKWPKVFSIFFVSVVRSGEISGKLDEVLNYLADELEKDYDVMSKVKNAMVYPIFVLSGLLIIGVIMMIFVVPKLIDLFSAAGGELPIATRILIATSNFLVSYWWMALIIIAGFIISFRFYVNKPFGRMQYDFVKLKIPVIGKLIQKICIVRFTRSMHTLMIGGVTISHSLNIASDIVGNKVYYVLIQKTIKAIEDGSSISSIFSTSSVMPKLVSQMMAVGEKTGKLDIILDRLAIFYSKEVNSVISNLMTLMEPIIIVILGIAVGATVAAVIMPMYNLAGQF